MRRRRREFDWQPVAARLADADLSYRVVDGRNIPERPPPWPSRRYADALAALQSWLIAPSPEQPMTMSAYEKTADLLYAELARALKTKPLHPWTEQRWREAAQALLDSKDLARAHRRIDPLGR